jgi:hypothetical protein
MIDPVLFLSLFSGKLNDSTLGSDYKRNLLPLPHEQLSSTIETENS